MANNSIHLLASANDAGLAGGSYNTLVWHAPVFNGYLLGTAIYSNGHHMPYKIDMITKKRIGLRLVTCGLKSRRESL